MTTTLQEYLTQNGIEFEILPQHSSSTSLASTRCTHVRGHLIAKPVIFEDKTGFLMAVVPANERVKVGKLNRMLNRDMSLAREEDLRNLFADCDSGAIPPIGSAYGIQSIIDDDLLRCSDIYFETGSHNELIHIKGRDFHKLMEGAPHSKISLH